MRTSTFCALPGSVGQLSEEFTAIRAVQRSQLRHFERCAYEVDG
jgi:hypothetical protein